MRLHYEISNIEPCFACDEPDQINRRETDGSKSQHYNHPFRDRIQTTLITKKSVRLSIQVSQWWKLGGHGIYFVFIRLS
jgi:hypothetical protein